MKKIFTIFLLMTITAVGLRAQNLRQQLSSWLDSYYRYDANISKPKLEDINVDDANRCVNIRIGGGFHEQHFTQEVVDSIYTRIRTFLPDDIRKYNIAVISEDHLIEEFIPNSLRTGKKDKSRLFQEHYKGEPWVRNLSRPSVPTEGLEGIHLSLWQSHGKYYNPNKGEWTWQRPRLYCTTEDLFSQTFVIPYIIPMLENAGAIVFTPRERDWQNYEAIVDNDNPARGGMYMESYTKKNSKHKWRTSNTLAFANNKQIYETVDTPFHDGTSRYTETVQGGKDISRIQWIPNIPESGKYAVYVTYNSFENSVEDAHYTVFHKGGMTEFSVNQKIGGGVWVYLGTFEFSRGTHDTGMVVLSNQSKGKGIVCADAVRFGGGMGNVTQASFSRQIPTSGLPRWAEGAKYSTLWYGFPRSVHTDAFGTDDYRNDINSRSAAVNMLSRGSVYNSQRSDGLGVPLELNIAFHTDAGYRTEEELIGSLAIYKTSFNDGKTGNGTDRYTSRDLASSLLTNLCTDLKKYNWRARKLWNRDYGEAREPMTPNCILEMLSHQNFYDMRLGYDPYFKFDFSRSVYKSIVKYLATMHQRAYVIQPLPIKKLSVQVNENKRTAELNWEAQLDPLEPTASPTHYILYTRIGNMGFDNGKIIKGTSCTVELEPDMVYSFRIAAANKGGQSFPSEVLAAGISSKSKGRVMIVNAFDRLEGPQSFDTANEQGFDIDADPGVQYGAFAGFCGRQIGFDKAKAGRETGDGLGVSSNEMEGKIVMGNTFDYASTHGRAVLLAGYSFSSMGDAAFASTYGKDTDALARNYNVVDVYYGVQKVFNPITSNAIDSYMRKGGRVIMSGANFSANRLSNKRLTDIKGCGLEFDIWREMNQYCYSVPAPSIIQPQGSAFSILTYQDGQSAAIASQQGMRYIKLGFPLEAITSTSKLNQLMNAFLTFLK